jgi:hypothetical protein
MPGQRRSAGPRARDSWVPRFAGLGVVIVVAAAAVTGYLLAFHPGSKPHAAALPTKVVSFQTVGLITQAAQPGAAPGQLLQLLAAGSAARFTVLSQTEAQQGSPQWTADQMAGGSYIFIYLKTGQCLAVAGPASQPRVVLQRCDLRAQQRWRRATAASMTQGHDFYEYANLGDGRCLTQAGLQPGQAYGAALAACGASGAASQLVAFWWSSV